MKYIRKALLVGIIFVVPFRADYPISSAGFSDLVILPVDILLVFGVLYIITRNVIGGNRSKIYVHNSLSLFATLILWGIMSTIWANIQIISLLHISYWIRGITVVFVVTNIVTSKGDLTLSIKAYIVSLSFHSFLSLAQWINQGPFGGEWMTYLGEPSQEFAIKTEDYYATRGMDVPLFEEMTFGHYAGGMVGGAYSLAVVLETVIPLMLVLYIYDKSSSIFKKRYLFVLLVVGIASVSLSLSRGAYLGLVSSIFIMFIVIALRRSKFGLYVFGGDYKKYMTIAFLLITLLSVPLIPKLSSPELSGTIDARLYKYSQALKSFSIKPVTGYGLGNAPNASKASIPNNMFLAYLVELGVVGFFIFLSFISSVFLAARNVLVARSGLYGVFALGLIIGLTSFLIHSQFDWVYRKVNTFPVFCVCISLIISTYKISFNK